MGNGVKNNSEVKKQGTKPKWPLLSWLYRTVLNVAAAGAQKDFFMIASNHLTPSSEFLAELGLCSTRTRSWELTNCPLVRNSESGQRCGTQLPGTRQEATAISPNTHAAQENTPSPYA